MGTGDNSGTWGDITNTNLGTAIEEAICESADVAFSGDSQTLTLSDANTTQVARHLRLNLTGTGSAGITLTVPDIEKNYIINNTLATDVGIKNSSGAQVTVPNGRSAIVYSTGSGVVDAITSLNTAEITQLTVTGDTDVTNLSADGTLDVSGNASVGGTFLVKDESNLEDVSASGTLDVSGNVSVGGTFRITNNVTASGTLNIGGVITGASTISDSIGNLRRIPKAAIHVDDHTLAASDAGKYLVLASSDMELTIPAATFEIGDLVTVLSTDGATASISSNITSFIAESASATATMTLGANGVVNILFVSAGYSIMTGNVS